MSSNQHYLDFKYILNRLIDLGNMEQYSIPMTYKTELNAAGLLTPQTTFNMDKVHRIRLADETPHMPEKEEDGEGNAMSDRLYQELCDDEWKRIREARATNDKTRIRVQHYVDEGVITIVEDPFARRTTKFLSEKDTPQAAARRAIERSAAAAEAAAGTKPKSKK